MWHFIYLSMIKMVDYENGRKYSENVKISFIDILILNAYKKRQTATLWCFTGCHFSNILWPKKQWTNKYFNILQMLECNLCSIYFIARTQFRVYIYEFYYKFVCFWSTYTHTQHWIIVVVIPLLVCCCCCCCYWRSYVYANEILRLNLMH